MAQPASVPSSRAAPAAPIAQPTKRKEARETAGALSAVPQQPAVKKLLLLLLQLPCLRSPDFAPTLLSGGLDNTAKSALLFLESSIGCVFSSNRTAPFSEREGALAFSMATEPLSDLEAGRAAHTEAQCSAGRGKVVEREGGEKRETAGETFIVSLGGEQASGATADVERAGGLVLYRHTAQTDTMQQERESAELCLNGCGFFGAPGSGGMCSVCWKKTMSDRQAAAASPRAAEAKVDAAAALQTTGPAETATADNNGAALAEEAAEDKKPAEKLVQKNKKRCWECKKKVGLTAIECRCGYVFCSNHRYADQHNCSFDFKAADRAELARRNPGGGQFGKLEKL
ncbi:unnamed protein product [Phytophthora lilii]|uniref:Unnamed protein product n=1 Tax=Phytophthora lilii TaxID=2077276 RepID=A0A9W6UCQ2_9STRA|nr:unnamed protein product [Phytophthora lilii]